VGLSPTTLGDISRKVQDLPHIRRRSRPRLKGMDSLTRSKLIVALDVETSARALELVSALRGLVGMFKVGMQLFTAAGPGLVREIIDSGERVFLDLKYHDIPNTVANAGVEAARLGVSIFNIHASGGREMMIRTAGAVSDCAEREGIARPKVIAVTLLTSADQETLAELGVNRTPEEQVGQLARLAAASGMDGVVASPREIAVVRSVVSKPGFLVVTPGVRSLDGELNDQRRITTAAEAIAAGADYIVVGRPILEAKDPARAAQAMIGEMTATFAH
jgi:orotidine-5'-phosphate decarboxylase